MKIGAYAIFSFLLLAMLCRYASQHTQNLPSRSPTGNHGQGINPGRDRCPSGTIPYYLDSGLFLECQR
jgi:hypothetical protein